MNRYAGQLDSDLVLGDEIGRGAHATVHRAERDGSVFAVKAMRQGAGARRRSLAARFRREGVTLATIDHPGFPKVHALGETDGLPYLVMDLIEGPTLAQCILEESFDEARLRTIGSQIADALAYIHSRGLVHRDVKPANIIVSAGDRVRLIDLGFVRRVEDTVGPAVAGTFLYSAPEQTGMLKRRVDGRADLYALGALLFEASTGMPPFRAVDVADLLHLHATRTAPDVREIRADVGDEFAAIVARLLRKDPADRFPDAVAVRDALESGQPSLSAIDGSADAEPSRSLAGRSVELGRLMSRWTAALRKRGSVVSVVGDPGSGKSTLMRTFADEVERSGGLVLRGRCLGREGVPFAPFRAALASRAQLATMSAAAGDPSGVDAIRDAAQGLERRILRFAPELSTVLHTPRARGGADDTHDQYIEAVATFVFRLSDDAGGAVFLLDDINDIDSASQRLLRRLAEQAPGRPLLMVLGSRGDPGSDRDSPECVDAAVHLAPMSDGQIAEVLAEQLGGVWLPADIIRYVVARAQGSPMAAVETLSAMVDEGALRIDWGRWHVDNDRLRALELPTGVVDLLLARVERLDPSAYAVLATAAVLGQSFRADVLAETSSLEVRPHVESALNDATDADLIEVVEPGIYAFSLRQVREHLVEQFPEGDRRVVHVRAAATLAGRNEDSDDALFALARHHREAEFDADPEWAFEAFVRAGRRALQAYAYEDAHAWVSLADAQQREHGLLVDDHYFETLGDTAAVTGRVEQAASHYARALQTAHGATRRAAMRARLAHALVANLDVARALEQVELGLSELGLDHSSGPARQVAIGVRDILRFVAARTLRRGPTLSDSERQRHRVIGLLLTAGSLVGYFSNRIPLMVEMGFRGVHNAHRLGPSPELVHAYALVAVMLAMTGRAQLADRIAAEAEVLAHRLDETSSIAVAKLHRAWAANMAGDILRAAALSAQCLHRHGQWLDALHYLNGCADLAWNLGVRGYYRESLEWVERGLYRTEVTMSRGVAIQGHTMIGHGGAMHAALGRTVVAARMLERARTLADAAPEDVFRRVAYTQYALLGAIESGDIDDALLGMADRVLRETGFTPLQTPFHLQKLYAYDLELHWLWALADDDERSRHKKLLSLESRVRRARRAARVPAVSTLVDAVEGGRLGLLGRVREGLDLLASAEAMGREYDSPVGLFGVARNRALVYRADGNGVAAERDATAALRLAVEHGWIGRARHVRRLFPALAASMPATEAGAGSGDAPSDSIPFSRSLGRSHSGIRAPQITADVAVVESDHGNLVLQRYLDALLEVNVASARLFDPERVARVALDRIIAIVGAQRAFIFTCKGDGDELELASGRDADGNDLVALTGYSSTVVEQARALREPIVVTGTQEGAVLGSQSAVAHDLRSILAVPLELGETLLGVVYLDNRLAEGFFTTEDVEILRAIANHIAISLETARSAMALTEARDAALAASRAKSTFLANMSHELRTPLNAIIGYAELIQEELEDRGEVDLVDDLARVRLAGSHLLSLISNILDLSRIEAGKLDVQMAPIDLDRFCAELGGHIGPLIAERGNIYRLTKPGPLGPLHTDELRLKQILLNLLNNAAKFTRDGEVELAVRRHDGNVVFDVRDTGIGIDPDALERLFDEFVQADMSSTRRYGGVGLGLAISARLCELLGGTIEVASIPGRGSTFTVTLPVPES